MSLMTIPSLDGHQYSKRVMPKHANPEKQSTSKYQYLLLIALPKAQVLNIGTFVLHYVAMIYCLFIFSYDSPVDRSLKANSRLTNPTHCGAIRLKRRCAETEL